MEQNLKENIFRQGTKPVGNFVATLHYDISNSCSCEFQWDESVGFFFFLKLGVGYMNSQWDESIGIFLKLGVGYMNSQWDESVGFFLGENG